LNIFPAIRCSREQEKDYGAYIYLTFRTFSFHLKKAIT
jgi:hypothetical protein